MRRIAGLVDFSVDVVPPFQPEIVPSSVAKMNAAGLPSRKKAGGSDHC